MGDDTLIPHPFYPTLVGAGCEPWLYQGPLPLGRESWILRFPWGKYMMPFHFLFNRKSPLITGLLWMGWVGHVFFFARILDRGSFSSKNLIFFYSLYISIAAAITIFRLIRWYKPADRGFGLEEHFQKSMIPVCYIMLVNNILLWVGVKSIFLFIVSGFLLLPMLVVNFILIYFYRKDSDSTPPGYFARSLYK